MRLIMVSMIIAIGLAIHFTTAYADGCSEQYSAMTKAAKTEYWKIENNYHEMLPEAENYISEIKDCIGSLANWTASIGFKLPSTSEILNNLCGEIKSHLDIPTFNFEYADSIGVGVEQTRYEVDEEDAAAIFTEIWNDIW